MTSAALTLTPLPGGFLAALNTLASLPDVSVKRLAQAVLALLRGGQERVPVEEVHQEIVDAWLNSPSEPPPSLGALRSAVRALDYTFRRAAACQATPEALRDALSAYATPGGALSESLCAAWSEAPLPASAASAFGSLLPAFSSLQCQLCLETTSWEEGEEGGERSAKLRPYVEAQLRTLQQGRMETHLLQLSLADFRELSKAVRGLKEGMDVHVPPV